MMEADTRAEFDAIAAELKSDAGAVLGKVFGMTCLKIGGKVFAGYNDGSMIFKLRGATHAAALGLPGSRLFDPSEMNRPMREWVDVPGEHSARWGEFAREALGYVEEGIERRS